MMPSRSWLTIDEPGMNMAIFVDQVAYIVQAGTGCKVVTTDGTSHVFHAIGFAEMLAKLTAPQVSYRLQPLVTEKP